MNETFARIPLDYFGDGDSGDLGLGLGRKPGGIVISDDENDDTSLSDDESNADNTDSTSPAGPSRDFNYTSFDEFLRETMTTESTTDDRFRVADVLKKRDTTEDGGQKLLNSNLKGYIKDFMIRRDRRQSENCSSSVPIPTHHGVRMGTSLQQERILFKRELEKLEQRRAVFKTGEAQDADGNRNDDDSDCLSEGGFLWRRRKLRILEKKLAASEADNAALRAHLERREEVLQSKHKAVKIMQAQLERLNTAKKFNEEKAKQRIEHLEREVNRVSFESDYKQGTLISSQETWAQRFDRVSEENQALMKTLEAKSEQVRDLHLRLDALQREKEELLALCGDQERRRFADLTGIADPESFVGDPQDSADWMMLGACNCADVPCTCARVAAHLRKKMTKLIEETEMATRLKEEATQIVSAYRVALEEQMERGRDLRQKLVDMATKSDEIQGDESRDADLRKKRGAQKTFKWVIQQLNTDDWKMLANAQAAEERNKRLEAQLEEEKREMVRAVRTEAALLLAEMLNDLNESLNQQKIVCHLLNIKNRELEAEMDEKSGFGRGTRDSSPDIPNHLEQDKRLDPNDLFDEPPEWLNSERIGESNSPESRNGKGCCQAKATELRAKLVESGPKDSDQLMEMADQFISKQS